MAAVWDFAQPWRFSTSGAATNGPDRTRKDRADEIGDRAEARAPEAGVECAPRLDAMKPLNKTREHPKHVSTNVEPEV